MFYWQLHSSGFILETSDSYRFYYQKHKWFCYALTFKNPFPKVAPFFYIYIDIIVWMNLIVSFLMALITNYSYFFKPIKMWHFFFSVLGFGSAKWIIWDAQKLNPELYVWKHYFILTCLPLHTKYLHELPFNTTLIREESKNMKQ